MLVQQIHRSFAESDETYGVRRVWPDLLAWGYDVGRERAARLIRQKGVQARPPKRKQPTDKGQRPTHALAPNTLDLIFTASQPKQRWAAYFTYIWATKGWLYVAVVLDLFSRRVIGWSMKALIMAELVMDVLIMAVWRRGPADSLQHHSDQGSQYASDKFQHLLAEHGIECSSRELLRQPQGRAC